MRCAVALLLLAFWPVVSSHAVLRHLGLIHQFHDDHDEESGDRGGSHEDHDTDHDVADGNCLLSSHEVSVPGPQLLATPPWTCLLVFEWSSALPAEQLPSGLAPPGSAPPELSHRWQFSFRAALPVRAPSF